ncbi:class I glutamine amidotransferase-like protein, partial [Corynespora cassiicola Philippines]
MRYSTFASLLAALPAALAAPEQPEIQNTTALPTHFGLLLFPHFQALDAFGPMDVLNTLAMLYKNNTMHLSIISKTMDPVFTAMEPTERSMKMNMTHNAFGQKVVPTHTIKDVLANGGKCLEGSLGHQAHGGPGHVQARHEGHDHAAPASSSVPAAPGAPAVPAPDAGMPAADDKGAIEVLIVPGGGGTREPMTEEIEFVKQMYPKLKYIISVCTGASILARAGILDGKKATTNKRAWEWATGTGPKTEWVGAARWVEDGNIWSSSGISAGIDVTYAWIGKVYGEEVADYVAQSSEYERWTDAGNDPFAQIWDV